MRWTVLLSVVLLALGLAACAADGGSSSSGSTVDGVQVLELEAADIKYNVSALAVQAGQPVRLNFENVGALEHDFSIAEIPVTEVRAEGDSGGHAHGAQEHDLHLLLAPGTAGVLEFTPTTPGTYVYQCTVPGHAGAGMRGELVVR